MQDRESLQDEGFLQRNPEYSVLADVLAAAIANNLLGRGSIRKPKALAGWSLNLNDFCVSR